MTTATATPTASKTATVTITYAHDEFITVRSERTGNELTLRFADAFVNWSREENEFFDRFMRGQSPRKCEVYYDTLARFKACVEKAHGPQSVKSAPVAIPTPQTNPAAVQAPVQTSFVVPVNDGKDNQVIDTPVVSSVPLTRTVAPASITKTSETVVARLGARQTSKSPSLLETSHRQAERIRDSLEKDYIVLWYLIPETLNSDCPNPAGLLRKLGFVHMDGSNWLGTTDMLETPRMKELFAHWDTYRCDGLEYHTFDIRERQKGQFRAIVERYIDRIVFQAHSSLLATIASADEQLEKALAELDQDPNAGEKQRSEKEIYRHNRVRTAIRNAGESLSVAVKAAEKYDDEQETRELFAALRQAIEAQAKSFNALAEAKRIKPAPLPK